MYRCIALISTVVASCPLEVYKQPGFKRIRFPLLERGNSAMTYTQFELSELVCMHLGGWGNAYVYKVRDSGDSIVDLKPINPALVQSVELDEDGNKVFLVKQVTPDGKVMQAAPPKIQTTFEIMHIPGLGYDGLTGLSPIGLARQTIGTAIAGDKLAARFFRTGSVLSGIVKVKAPLANQGQADTIKAKWLANHGGVGNAATVAVLDAETDFQPITINPDDLQFLESRRWGTTEIARMYGIPPHLVGDVEKSTSWGSGIEEQNQGFVAYTIAGWTNRIEQRIEREVVNTRGQFCEYNLDRLLRGSTIERYQSYALGIQWGWLTRADARDNENMEPIDGLDEPLVPLNMQAGSAATEMINPGAAPLGPKDTKPPASGKQQTQDDEIPS